MINWLIKSNVIKLDIFTELAKEKKRYRVEEFSGQAQVVVQGQKGNSLETHHDNLLKHRRKNKWYRKKNKDRTVNGHKLKYLPSKTKLKKMNYHILLLFMEIGKIPLNREYFFVTANASNKRNTNKVIIKFSYKWKLQIELRWNWKMRTHSKQQHKAQLV